MEDRMEKDRAGMVLVQMRKQLRRKCLELIFCIISSICILILVFSGIEAKQEIEDLKIRLERCESMCEDFADKEK
jgi:hypothetical protein